MALLTPPTDDAPAVLASNRARLERDLLHRIGNLEARYELSSDRLETELARGRMRETSEVAMWIVLWRTLKSLRDAAHGAR